MLYLGTLQIHTRAARIIYGLAWDTPSQTIQESVKWKPLKLFYHLNLLSLVFNSYYDLSPLSVRKLFDKRERTYNFRKTNCLRLPKPRLDLIKKSISFQGAHYGTHLVTMIEPLIFLLF